MPWHQGRPLASVWSWVSLLVKEGAVVLFRHDRLHDAVVVVAAAVDESPHVALPLGVHAEQHALRRLAPLEDVLARRWVDDRAHELLCLRQ